MWEGRAGAGASGAGVPCPQLPPGRGSRDVCSGEQCRRIPAAPGGAAQGSGGLGTVWLWFWAPPAEAPAASAVSFPGTDTGDSVTKSLLPPGEEAGGVPGTGGLQLNLNFRDIMKNFWHCISISQILHGVYLH